MDSAPSPAIVLPVEDVHSAAPLGIPLTAKKPSLNASYRRPVTLPFAKRVISEPLLGRPPFESGIPRRSKSESLQRERLMQFFLKPSMGPRIGSVASALPSCISAHSGPQATDKQSRCIDLSVLSPNEYKYAQGTITILPSRSFVIDFCHGAKCLQGDELELLLVNPASNTVSSSPSASCFQLLTQGRYVFTRPLVDHLNWIALAIQNASGSQESYRNRTAMRTTRLSHTWKTSKNGLLRYAHSRISLSPSLKSSPPDDTTPHRWQVHDDVQHPAPGH